ncbi:hypothetical protein [Sphingomonas sp. PB4P5]|uniref:hypothetical protein n=1 Tax=Parasphingomonas puruogangriensis TaxID=3096155 RepID=UPI002FC82FFD
MTAAPPSLVDLVSGMPDIVKLTVSGLALDPPTLDVRTASRTMIEMLDHLVLLGIAVVVIAGLKRAYRLTLFGVEVYEEIRKRSPSDATIAANDRGCDPDDAA